MLEPSPRLRREASRIGCEPNHIIMADLILSGYTNAEAYDIAYSENASLSAQRKIEDRDRVLASEGYKRAYETKKMTRKYATETVEARGKEDIIRELNTLANTAGTDTKLKAELLMKIADLQQFKKEMTGDEDPVRFFFPIACEKCPLLQTYNDYLARKNGETPEEEWDLEVRPDEMQRLIEQADTVIIDMRKKERAR